MPAERYRGWFGESWGQNGGGYVLPGIRLNVQKSGLYFLYAIEAKVFNRGLKGQGTIKVKKHVLPAGVTQEPPGPPDPV